MTLMEENKKLRDLLIVALSGDTESWKSEAEKILDIKNEIKTINTGHKWEGDICICKHSVNVHASGGGMCFAANCECMNFEIDKIIKQ